MAKWGPFLAADPLVVTSVTSFSPKSGVIPLDNLALLSRLQELPIHTPPLMRAPIALAFVLPLRQKLRKKRRLAKEAKQKVAKDKKLADVACKATKLMKKQECFISSAKSKVAKPQPRRTNFVSSWPK
jgi:hypothetical protein